MSKVSAHLELSKGELLFLHDIYYSAMVRQTCHERIVLLY
jgi:hypothetical protein